MSFKCTNSISSLVEMIKRTVTKSPMFNGFLVVIFCNTWPLSVFSLGITLLK
jgi:hypothetical protein